MKTSGHRVAEEGENPAVYCQLGYSFAAATDGAGGDSGFPFDGEIALMAVVARPFTWSANPGTVLSACFTLSEETSSCHGLP